MKDNKLTPELTEAEMSAFEKKAEELASIHRVSKVTPVVFIEPDTLKRVVAYVKEPNYPTKVRVMDKMVTTGSYSAADELREACLIKEESDPLTYGEGPECDSPKLGVTTHMLSVVKVMQNQFKKK